MADQPTGVPSTTVAETPPDGSTDSHHSAGLIPVRNSSDQEIEDAVDGMLRTVSVQNLLSASPMLMSLETVQGASPIWLYYLKQLYDSKRFPYTTDYTDVFIQNILIEMLYSDIDEVAHISSGTRSTGSSAGPDYGVSRLQRSTLEKLVRADGVQIECLQETGGQF